MAWGIIMTAITLLGLVVIGMMSIELEGKKPPPQVSKKIIEPPSEVIERKKAA